MDLKKYCDKRPMSGYGSALLYYNPSDVNEKDADGNYLYHLLLPLETAPTVTGSTDTFDFDILTCPSKGQVEGKETLDQKDVDFLWHRDNVARLEALQGKVLEFLVVYQDFTARAFTGTIKVKPQDAGADIMRGTFTITPLSAVSSTFLDARDLIKDTVMFTNAIPAMAQIEVGKTFTNEIKTDPSSATITTKSNNTKFSATATDGTLTITHSGTTAGETALIEITATNTGYASWTTYIAVESI